MGEGEYEYEQQLIASAGEETLYEICAECRSESDEAGHFVMCDKHAKEYDDLPF